MASIGNSKFLIFSKKLKSSILRRKVNNKIIEEKNKDNKKLFLLFFIFTVNKIGKTIKLL